MPVLALTKHQPLAMNDKLDLLLVDGVIDEVLGRLKSGEEANISLITMRALM